MRAARAALLTCALSAGCAPSHLGPFERTLAAHDSATVALGEWCGARGLAEPPEITAEPLATGREAPPEVRRLLGVGAAEPLGFRRVALRCGDHVLSVAENWYVPARLTAEMNHSLATTRTPFGKVAAPVGFARERLSSRRGREADCPPATVLSHRALLRLPEGRPLSLVTECYTRANLRR
jgi:chorismate-pyruvate lyase